MKTIRGKFEGFTLIELMVAISIVAILATIGFTILQTAQASSRDAKRRGDLDAISQALETNWSATVSQYPSINSIQVTGFTTGVKPSDPLSSGNYNYYFNGIDTTANTSYVVCALLERGGGNSTVSTAITNGATMSYYCKKNQQQ